MEKIISKKEYLRAANADGIAIFEGTAGWCPQCKAIAPKVEELRQKWPDVRWYEYDVEKVEDVAQELGVKVMPTFTIFKDGDLEDSITGAKPAKLEEAIASLMK